MFYYLNIKTFFVLLTLLLSDLAFIPLKHLAVFLHASILLLYRICSPSFYTDSSLFCIFFILPSPPYLRLICKTLSSLSQGTSASLLLHAHLLLD